MPARRYDERMDKNLYYVNFGSREKRCWSHKAAVEYAKQVAKNIKGNITIEDHTWSGEWENTAPRIVRM